MECRPGCAACCIAPSISSPLPGLPDGKPAGEPCLHLDQKLGCRLFGQPERPRVCSEFTPSAENCGVCREEALERLSLWEKLTAL
ncbi:YkgJ family cysteine cluster protein [Dongshaea marina]|uniref:YkgJ family cysteine cluster protein n=1 Tax=Dongshaea marina TaxID=2047966 RepID=UPI00131F4193|nr:YkgJ family cysteine cluster protein [Dongshaea marina]